MKHSRRGFLLYLYLFMVPALGLEPILAFGEEVPYAAANLHRHTLPAPAALVFGGFAIAGAVAAARRRRKAKDDEEGKVNSKLQKARE